MNAEFTHSESLTALTKALAAARTCFKPVKKTADNPFYKSKYADLAGIIAATVDALCGQGLAVIQSPGHVREGEIFVTTLLLHSSGEWVRGEISLPVSKADAQGAGSAITYARRYAYQAILNIAADEDDDANAAVSDRQYASSTEKGKGTINQTQQRAFWAAIKQSGKTIDQAAEYLKAQGVTKTEELLKKDFEQHMKWATGHNALLDDLSEPLTESVKAADQQKWKVFFARAKEMGISNEDVHSYAKDNYGVSSLKDLTREQFIQLQGWVNSNPFELKA